jgi:predicted nucleotidyltransferase
MRDSTTNDQTLSPGLTEKITAILSDKVMFALLFGSSVTGRLTPESDIGV